MLYAIDPGVHKSGVALFNDGLLMYAGWHEHAGSELLALTNDIVRVEMPRIYPGSGQRKGDLNDLLDLAAVVGYWEDRLRGSQDVKRVFPATWKGQVPKKIMNARVMAKLSEREAHTIRHVGAKDHNIIDAIGIGLWALGRL